MQARINFSILICLFCLVTAALGEQPVSVPAANVNRTAELTFPYVAQITADRVNIRAGAGTNYYICGQLGKGDKVKIVGSQFSWSRIEPPPGSFSWVSTRYVSVDPNNPGIGTVTGDNVRIWAGSENLKPIHSTKWQRKLNTGDKVRLMGEQQGEYYKIVPPEGAYLWVSTQYTEPLRTAVPVEEPPLVGVPAEEPLEKAPVRLTPAVVPTTLSIESEMLNKYYDLDKQIKAEKKKPIGRQDYSVIKKALLKIAENQQAGKAARYAKFSLEQMGRFELALQVEQAVQLQNKQLRQIKRGIEQARVTKLEQVVDLGKFAVVGQFQTSSVYGPEPELKHYKVTDKSGGIICYALPADSASRTNLGRFIGRKVGLIGKIEPHRQTSGAMVRFSEIVELK